GKSTAEQREDGATDQENYPILTRSWRGVFERRSFIAHNGDLTTNHCLSSRSALRSANWLPWRSCSRRVAGGSGEHPLVADFLALEVADDAREAGERLSILDPVL